MAKHTLLAGVLLAFWFSATQATVQILNSWDGGFQGKFVVPVTTATDGTWKVRLQFSKKVQNFQTWRADVIDKLDDGATYILANKEWNGYISAGEKIEMTFIANIRGRTPTATVELVGANNPTPGPTTTESTIDALCTFDVSETWPGHFKGRIGINVKNSYQDGWTVILIFSKQVHILQIWEASVFSKKAGGKKYILRNKSYNKQLNAGSKLELGFIGSVEGTPPTGICKITTAEVQTTASTTLSTASTESTTLSTASTESTTTLSTAPTKSTTLSTAPTESTTLSTASTESTTLSTASTESTTLSTAPTESTTLSTAPTKSTTLSTASTESTTLSTASTESTIKSTPFSTLSTASTESTTSSSTFTASTTLSNAAYDYGEVLRLSVLFYEAQRSGKLPDDNRISWRKDSALGDKGNNGEDLTGGWYDAGDYVKFGFPMAGSATNLIWGLLEFEKGYKAAGQYDVAVSGVKWALDYFIKCHVADNEFYGQVGDGNDDHNFWGRPEDMTMVRPAFKIDTSKPGSDLAGETAAALAAGSILFKNIDPTYSATLLDHAKRLYDFAFNFRGLYHTAITDASQFYRSYGYNDELCWGALWLYKATSDRQYLDKAKQFLPTSVPWAFSWDDKVAGCLVLLHELGITDTFSHLEGFLKQWFPGGAITYTPGGLAWRGKWGSLRYSSHTALIALVAANHGVLSSEGREFATKQIGYMLGDNGRSFVVGFGVNPPQRPHHSSSSCPSAPATCDWSDFNNPSPNAHILYGALVGGPDDNDRYTDDRTNFVTNEVTCDYNAGFQGALAGLKEIHG